MANGQPNPCKYADLVITCTCNVYNPCCAVYDAFSQGELLTLLGGTDKLVGTVSVINSNPWLKEVYPNIVNIPALTNGQSVQLESLLAQKPDVVLLSSREMLKEVEQAGLKGVLTGFQNFEGLKETVRLTAAVIGDNAPQIAKQYIEELEGNMAFVADRLKDIKDEQKPAVIHNF